ncbi:MAG: hypothetical protein WCO98_13595 [bacterium]
MTENKEHENYNREENKDGNSKINTTLNCPFCSAIIIEEVDMEPWEYDEMYELYGKDIEKCSGKYHMIRPFCEHLAFFGMLWGLNQEEIAEKWSNEMLILAKNLGAEIIESERLYDSYGRENSPVNVIAETILFNDDSKKENYEKIQDTLIRLFPDCDSSVLKECLNDESIFTMIFMKKK